MSFDPKEFVGRALSDLVSELARARPGEVEAGLELHALIPRARVFGGMTGPAVTWQTSWLKSPDPAETLPSPQHPNVVPDDVTLGEYLGGGTQGAVYAGRVRSTGLVVAVKVIRSGGDEGAAQAIREAGIGAKLRHPNVLRVFGYQQVAGFHVVVMEFLQGDNLAACPVPLPEAKVLLARLADAVLAIGRARVVHRDIKPANIIRRADGEPVIVDFGTAVDLDALTKNPGMAGTPLYMAPEAVTSGWPEPSWDAYSLGVTAVALWAPTRLPGGGGVTQVLMAKVSGDYDRELLELLTQMPDAGLRAWCADLVGPAPARVAALERARSLVG